MQAGVPKALDGFETPHPLSNLCTSCLALLSDIPNWSRPTEVTLKLGNEELAYWTLFASGYEQLKTGKTSGCSFCATLYHLEQQHEAYVFSRVTERVTAGPADPRIAFAATADWTSQYHLLEDERLFEAGTFDIQLKCWIRRFSSFPDLGTLTVYLYEHGAWERIGELNISAEKGQYKRVQV